MKHSDEGANWKKALVHLWISFLLLLFFYLLSFGCHWRKTRHFLHEGSVPFRTQQSWTGEVRDHVPAFHLVEITKATTRQPF